MPSLFGNNCAVKAKSISVYLPRCGFPGWTDEGTYFLVGQFVDDGCPGAGVGTTTCTKTRKSCHQDDTYIPGPFGTGTCFDFDGGGSLISQTNTVKHWNASCGNDHGYLSEEYTLDLLKEDADEILDEGAIGEKEFGTFTDLSYDESGLLGTPYPYDFSGDGSLIAVHYVEDPAEPDKTSFIVKSRLQFVPCKDHYVKLFYPQDGGPCTRTVESCTPGDTVTIDPPEDYGSYDIRACAAEDTCS